MRNTVGDHRANSTRNIQNQSTLLHDIFTKTLTISQDSSSTWVPRANISIQAKFPCFRSRILAAPLYTVDASKRALRARNITTCVHLGYDWWIEFLYKLELTNDFTWNISRTVGMEAQSSSRFLIIGRRSEHNCGSSTIEMLTRIV